MRAYVERATIKDVLGVKLPVAAVEDVLAGKILAALDVKRRPSKQIKDLADIARILEVRPELNGQVPDSVHRRISGAQARESQ